LSEVYTKGFYNADSINVNYRRLIIHSQKDIEAELNEREKKFLQLASSDMTYKQIASEMNLSERTVDGYREAIFEKFKVQSRVGMVMEGLRKGLIRL
jgi:DNA-binding NarL/FixJ family response regulator